MAYKIYKKGNYINIVDTSNNNLIEESASDVFISKATTSSTNYNVSLKRSESLVNVPLADIQDEAGVAYVLGAWETFYQAETGDPARAGLPVGAATEAKQDVIISNTNKPTTVSDGRKIVAIAGTRETLVAAPTTAKCLTITAETGNTGIVVVGGVTVVAALATRRGVPLNAGVSYEVVIDDLQKIYIDTTVSGNGVTFTYFN